MLTMLRFLILLLGLAALIVIGLLVVTLGGAVFAATIGMRNLRGRVAALKIRWRKGAPTDDPLEAAWLAAARAADWADSRVAVARASCTRLIEIADADPLATEAVDWANVIRRRVPDLVEACMAECADATASERRHNLDDLVESLEKIGAEAERRRDRFRAARATPFEVQRTYVDQRTRPDPMN